MSTKGEIREIRLQKVIADNAVCSRREAEMLIKDGLVRVNGKIAELGQKVDPARDMIVVRGKALSKGHPKEPMVFILFKPKGYICSHSDPYHESTIFNLLPKELAKTKLICAGRLDKDSEGLVVLTNDGAMANKIMHPSKGIVKRYRVMLDKPLDERIIPKILKGIHDDGEHLYAKRLILAKAGPKASQRLDIHLDQGHKREIRRLFERFGYNVIKLHPFQIGSLILKGLAKGSFKQLKKQEIDLLFKN